MILLRQQRDAEGIPELNIYVSSPNAKPATAAETRQVIANPLRASTPSVPKFSFTTHDNQTISNGALRGKVLRMDFWGTWSTPCRKSIPMPRDTTKTC